MDLAQQPIYPMHDGRKKMAMAWIVDLGPADSQTTLHPELVKDGATAGFSSAIVLNHFKDVAIFIAINRAKLDPVPAGVGIGRQLH